MFGHRKSVLGGLTTWFLRKAIHLSGRAKAEALTLRSRPSAYLEGMRNIVASPDGQAVQGGVVIATLRMGYGHYRFGLSLADAALAQGKVPYWLDFSNLPSTMSTLLQEINRHYSRLSRLASNGGRMTHRFWDRVTAAGDWNALQISTGLAPTFAYLMGDLNPTLPFLSTFVWTGQIAVAARFHNVIHLVQDNAPMPFILVPGALNLVQSPSMYSSLLRLGVPARSMALAGHWVPQTLASQAPFHCETRIQRLQRHDPRRVLISIGGAGAQISTIVRILHHLAPFIAAQSCSVFINAGDHRFIYQHLRHLLERTRVPLTLMTDWPQSAALADRFALGAADEPQGIYLFHFKEHFPSVALTDRLIMASDVLITKPSELAFYPIPKLMLKRVGSHEGPGATRASELGDGTPECQRWSETRFFLDEIIHRPDLLSRLNEQIVRNCSQGIYDGSRRAVEMAFDRSLTC